MKKLCSSAATAAGLFLAAGGLWAFTVQTAPDGSFLTWPRDRTAIFYRVGSGGETVSPGAVEDIGRAFSQWEEKSRGELAFIYEGVTEGGKAVRDGHNTISWVSGYWPYGEETAAVSTIWISEEDNEIEEVDIEFNARDYDWELPGSPDLLEAALHEIGHLLGIGHSFNPGAVMHDTRRSGVAHRRTLSRDDLEALAFLYPRREREIHQFDLPVLFYPHYFAGEDPAFPPAAGLEPDPGRWVTALGSIDLSGDGYLSEVLTAVRDETGGKTLEGWGPAESGADLFEELGTSREVSVPGSILALAGVDYLRDGRGGEAAVLVRDGGREELLFFRFDSDWGGPEAVLELESAPADNLVGMAALDSTGSGFRDGLLLLRAFPDRYSLFLHRVPGYGEASPGPDPGVEIPLPGLQRNSRLLGLAVLDAEGTGRRDDLVLLELDDSGDYWLHLFALAGPDWEQSYDVFYRRSARLPSGPGSVHPGRVTGLDFNRDGLYDQLIILAPGR